MTKMSAYWRLMRFDKPVGIYLLWFPTAWALWWANQGRPPLSLVLLFFMGTVLMRAAGCVINDIADRDIDKHVRRTQLRPLAVGTLQLRQALILLAVLLCFALAILLYLPRACLPWAITALVITGIYPLCKRWIQAPQLVLGFAFSMGIPMAFSASGVAINYDVLLLCGINILWTIAYDTMYAMVDKEDDLLIGVKSTAILFADYDVLMINVLYASSHILWLLLAYYHSLPALFYLLWSLAALLFYLQYQWFSTRIPSLCFRAFLASTYYGLWMWLILLIT